MLQAMRDKVMGGLGWFIIGLIIIAILMGILSVNDLAI